MIRYYIVILSLFTTTFIYSQNYYEDIKKASQCFVDEKPLSMDVLVKAYYSKSQTTGDLIASPIMRKSGSKYYSKYLTSEVISDGKRVLMIDHSSKEMTLFMERKKAPEYERMEADLNNLKKGVDTIIYLGESPEGKSYKLQLKNNFISAVDITFAKDASNIKKLIYYYAEDTDEVSMEMFKSEVIYKSITESVNDNKIFNISKYCIKKGSKYIATEGYNGYKVSIVE